MLKAIAMVDRRADKKMMASMKRHAANIQREITYEELVTVQAKALADKLTEAEFNILITEHRKPALNKLLTEQLLADREFGEGANKYISENILPSLMSELMAAMHSDDSKAASEEQ